MESVQVRVAGETLVFSSGATSERWAPENWMAVGLLSDGGSVMLHYCALKDADAALVVDESGTTIYKMTDDERVEEHRLLTRQPWTDDNLGLLCATPLPCGAVVLTGEYAHTVLHTAVVHGRVFGSLAIETPSPSARRALERVQERSYENLLQLMRDELAWGASLIAFDPAKQRDLPQTWAPLLRTLPSVDDPGVQVGALVRTNDKRVVAVHMSADSGDVELALLDSLGSSTEGPWGTRMVEVSAAMSGTGLILARCGNATVVSVVVDDAELPVMPSGPVVARSLSIRLLLRAGEDLDVELLGATAVHVEPGVPYSTPAAGGCVVTGSFADGPDALFCRGLPEFACAPAGGPARAHAFHPSLGVELGRRNPMRAFETIVLRVPRNMALDFGPLSEMRALPMVHVDLRDWAAGDRVCHDDDLGEDFLAIDSCYEADPHGLVFLAGVTVRAFAEQRAIFKVAERRLGLGAAREDTITIWNNRWTGRGVEMLQQSARGVAIEYEEAMRALEEDDLQRAIEISLRT